jgi:hypothetical protein
LTDLFGRLDYQEAWERYRLSDEQVESFHNEGFLAGIDVLGDEQVEVLLEELAELMQPRQADNDLWYEFHWNESPGTDRVLFHALGAWRIKPAFHDVLWNPAFLIPASQLLGGPVRFWHDQLFCKPPRDGGVVAWHQDYSYWTRTEPMAHLTCWIGLDDTTSDNGCVQYISGSHRWPLLPATGLAGDMNGIRAVLNDAQWDQFHQPVAVELRRGQCTFHHPLVVHGSAANVTNRPRRATVINVFRDGVMSARDDAPLRGVSPIPRGQKMQGQFFPLLTLP